MGCFVDSQEGAYRGREDMALSVGSEDCVWEEAMAAAGAKLTMHPGLGAVVSTLGYAALLGGRPKLERSVASDEFVRLFARMDIKGRIEALGTISRMLAVTPAEPPKLPPPNPNSRIKVRWTDDMIARLRQHARLSMSNETLTQRLGLPAYCLHAVRLGRRRYAPETVVKRPRGRPRKQPPMTEMRLAA